MATKGVKLKDSYNNIILPITSSDLIEVNYGGQSQILTNLLEQNEQITTEALADLNTRLELIPSSVLVSGTIGYVLGGVVNVPYAKTTYDSEFPLSGGAVVGTIMNEYNSGSSNITTVPLGQYYTRDAVEGDDSLVGLRYETPFIRIVSPTVGHEDITPGIILPSSSTVHKSFYEPLSYGLFKLNIARQSQGLGGLPAIVSSYMIDGNNYCDVSDSSYEMFFFNTDHLQNYLTAYARIDIDRKELKEIESSWDLQWGPCDDTTDQYNTLSLSKEKISFSKYVEDALVTGIEGNSTEITNDTVISGYVYARNLSKSVPSAYSVAIRHDQVRLINSGNIKINLGINSSYFYHPVYGSQFYETSDERLKNNITKIASFDDINIYSFVKNDCVSYSYGFIAQDIAKTHPETISYNSNEYLSVDYNSALSLMLAKALNKIDELEKRIEQLENNAK